VQRFGFEFHFFFSLFLSLAVAGMHALLASPPWSAVNLDVLSGAMHDFRAGSARTLEEALAKSTTALAEAEAAAAARADALKASEAREAALLLELSAARGAHCGAHGGPGSHPQPWVWGHHVGVGQYFGPYLTA
jgi:hypothetical protein